MITQVKYTDLDHTNVKITLDDGREFFANVEGSTWLHTELRKWLNHNTPEVFVPVTPAIASVSKRQARLALLEVGLLDDLEVAIESISDPVQKKVARIEWDTADVISRDWPLLVSVAKGQLGMTDAQLDGLFALASAK